MSSPESAVIRVSKPRVSGKTVRNGAHVKLAKGENLSHRSVTLIVYVTEIGSARAEEAIGTNSHAVTKSRARGLILRPPVTPRGGTGARCEPQRVPAKVHSTNESK